MPLRVPVALCALASAVELSSFVAPAAAQPVQPLVREDAVEKISAHVHVIPDASVSLVPNVGFVVGERGIFVIDTGLGERNGATVARVARTLSPTGKIWLGTTHFHPEHDLGAKAFPAATQLLRSRDQQKDIDEFGLQLAKTFSGRSPFIAELLKGAEFRAADEHFDREHTIDLGGVKVRMIAMGPNHTRGDTAFFVEPDGVLFSGDVAMKPQPSFASPYSSVRHWLESLDLFDSLKPQRIVPSHGPLGDVGLVAGYRTYLTTIQTSAAALKKQGKSIDEAAQTVADELKDKYPDRQRLIGAARAAYNESP